MVASTGVVCLSRCCRLSRKETDDVYLVTIFYGVDVSMRVDGLVLGVDVVALAGLGMVISQLAYSD